MLGKRLFILVLAALSISFSLYAKITEIEGSYKLYLPRDISRDRGELIALERAKVRALDLEFGSLISEYTRMDSRVTEQGESNDFWSTASSTIRGEWIETIGKPEFLCYMEKDEIVIECKVKGRARTLENNKADISVTVLRNDAQTEDNTFIDGDRILMKFASAVDGYLTVFLEDDRGAVYRLLPFYFEGSGSKHVEGGKDYLWFASTLDEAEQYRLTAENRIERNILYIVFSPNEYIKPIDKKGSDTQSLRELSTKDFHNWLNARRGSDDRLQVITRPITISPQ